MEFDFNQLKHKQWKESFILKKFPEIHEHLAAQYPDIPWNEKIYWFMHGLTSHPVCKYCGKYTSFIAHTKGYREYCSRTCQSRATRQRAASTMQQKYGGVGMASPITSTKIKKTKQQKYGDENYSNRNKFISTMTSIYGGCGYASPDINAKCQKTTKDKYGVLNVTSLKEIQSKIIRTNNKKYGADRPSKSKSVINKIINSRRQSCMETIDDLIGYTPDGKWICACPHPECDKCDEKYYIDEHSLRYDRLKRGAELCTKLLPYSPNISSQEIWVHNLLDGMNIEYETSVRNIIPPLELDIYVPKFKIAFEINGCRWHSANEKSSKYHMDKWKMCDHKGIRLITIWEDQIKRIPEIVESVILSKLGIYERRIGARKCMVEKITGSQGNTFLNKNHIQGRTVATYYYGLFYKNELVGVMCFGKTNKLSGSGKEEAWDLRRFCTLNNIQVIGGASKLMKRFIKDVRPEKIISWSSCDISTGDVYNKLGFETTGVLTQSYWYINKNTYKRYHRSSFQKSSLKKMGFDTEHLTESQIMSDLPYWKIYDCGHIKWTMDVPKGN